MSDTELLEQITRTIVEPFHPRRIILFGTQARGEASSESDLDLFLLNIENNLWVGRVPSSDS